MASSSHFNPYCRPELIEVTKLIDLTDKPIRLTSDEIGWSKVRATASNCICCCCNNSITLVTTKDSYILDHIPLENVKFAQTNPSLNYLALSNHRKIVIIELVDSNLSEKQNSRPKSEVKVVNLAASGLTIKDVVFWRWIDNETLAILTEESLFICAIQQAQINHPAYTALSDRTRPLFMEKICDVHSHLTNLCQVTDIHCNHSKSLYVVSGLYSTETLQNLSSNNGNNTHQTISTNNRVDQSTTSALNSKLKPSFGSMPSRLSQLVHNDQLAENIKLDHSFDLRRLASYSSLHQNEDTIGGLVQIHCKMRDRSQLIQAHAATFTTKIDSLEDTNVNNDDISSTTKTLLVAANKIGSQMRVNFIEMATPSNPIPSSTHNWSPLTSFDSLDGQDIPTSIICSYIHQDDGKRLPVAMIVTKQGQLYVFSIVHGTKLFQTRMVNETISSTILESETRGLMAICRSGQVLLVRLLSSGINRLLVEKRKLVRSNMSSSHIESMNVSSEGHSDTEKHISYDLIERRMIRKQPSLTDSSSHSNTSLSNQDQKSSSLDAGLEVLISTKL